MNNLLSYCGLVDANISASDKDLPVHSSFVANNLKKQQEVVWVKQCKYSGQHDRCLCISIGFK